MKKPLTLEEFIKLIQYEHAWRGDDTPEPLRSKLLNMYDGYVIGFETSKKLQAALVKSADFMLQALRDECKVNLKKTNDLRNEIISILEDEKVHDQQS